MFHEAVQIGAATFAAAKVAVSVAVDNSGMFQCNTPVWGCSRCGGVAISGLRSLALRGSRAYGI